MIRKRGTGLQVQVYAGRDPLSGRKRYVSQQVPGQTKASMREAKQIEARLLAEVCTGQHKGSRSRTMAELLERWLEWRPTVRPIAPTTVSSYRAGPAAGPSPNYGRWGTEALAPAMEVSVLEAKRLGHRAVLRLSWLLLVASVALSTSSSQASKH